MAGVSWINFIHLFDKPQINLIKMRIPVYKLMPLFLLWVTCTTKEITETKYTKTIFQAIRLAEPVELRLTTRLQNLVGNTSEESYQNAALEIIDQNGPLRVYQVEIRPRGITRRKFCSFPPLKIKFKKAELQRDSLSDHNELKLVTHCQPDSLYDQLILKEDMVYRLYNVLTDRSFQTQLIRITYADSAQSVPSMTRYGFLIEGEHELASRLGGTFMPDGVELPKILDKDQYKLFVYFQYMIGNTDWNLGNHHNNGLLTFESGQPEGKTASPYPIPYDFDYSGLVNAPYAQVFESLPISNVRERLLMWRGKKDEDFSATVQIFKHKQAELQAVIDNTTGLSDSIREDALNYLDSFFPLLDHPEQIMSGPAQKEAKK